MREITVFEWVEALRSGEYQQTRFQLHDSNGYCCLGVAEDVAGAHWTVFGLDKDSITVYTDDWQGTNLPSSYAKELMGEAGAFMEHSYAPGVDSYLIRENVLAEMNDEGWTFLEIADSIMGMYLG